MVIAECQSHDFHCVVHDTTDGYVDGLGMTSFRPVSHSTPGGPDAWNCPRQPIPVQPLSSCPMSSARSPPRYTCSGACGWNNQNNRSALEYWARITHVLASEGAWSGRVRVCSVREADDSDGNGTDAVHPPSVARCHPFTCLSRSFPAQRPRPTSECGVRNSFCA